MFNKSKVFKTLSKDIAVIEDINLLSESMIKDYDYEYLSEYELKQILRIRDTTRTLSDALINIAKLIYQNK
jgi:hypothetical protein